MREVKGFERIQSARLDSVVILVTQTVAVINNDAGLHVGQRERFDQQLRSLPFLDRLLKSLALEGDHGTVGMDRAAADAINVETGTGAIVGELHVGIPAPGFRQNLDANVDGDSAGHRRRVRRAARPLPQPQDAEAHW
jgi:hypothetical protein